MWPEIFRKKERAEELLIVFFENSSPKGTFRRNKMKSEIFDIYSQELLSFWKASKCAGSHTNVFPFLNRRLKGSATCA